MLRWILIAVGVVVLASVAIAVAVMRATPPTIEIGQPTGVVGQRSALEVTAGGPRARFDTLTVVLEQDGRSIPLFGLDAPGDADLAQPDADHLRVTRPIGKVSVPELKSGTARLVATVSRSSFLGLRTLTATSSRDFRVSLEPPRVAVLSTKHYVNHGGSEVVLYRATPPDVTSGVRVGDLEYTSYPAAGAGLQGADPALRIAFFALLHDQDLRTPIAVFARDEAGNEATASFVDNVFEKPFRRSRIEIDDRFLERVVPEIQANAPELGATDASVNRLASFLKINGELRRLNGQRISYASGRTSTSRLWSGPFVQLGNSKVEASFADHRTYIHNGREVDQQVHLGFDLAVTARVPIVAANAGTVLHAGWLGIYGQAVIVDHGMGVASLYGHLSSLDVEIGRPVTKGQTLGRSGMTGLAGGDHLHFTMLVGGRP